MKKAALISLGVLALPLVALAQTPDLAPLQIFIINVGRIVGMLVPILIGAALIVFFWGLVVYLFKQDHKAGRQLMLWGLITLFVMVAVWGIVRLGASALGVQLGGNAPAPGIPGYNQQSGY